MHSANTSRTAPNGPPPEAVSDACRSAPSSAELAEALAMELGDAWQAGQRRLCEDYLERHPLIRKDRDGFLRLICEELCLRQEHGETVTGDELARRFPEWRDDLNNLLDCHNLIQQEPDRARELPRQTEDCVTVAELGRGAQGHVYLATQPALGDRPVVLKITPLQGREHLALARLQHTHIVPLFWCQDDPRQDCRTLCMPYFGTVTLAKALNILAATPASKRSGRDILAVLDEAAAGAPVALPTSGPTRTFLNRASYIEAICWIGACLADALHYAHERGLVHLDLKPSNVLLAADGQPMLLDFHVAQEPIQAGDRALDWLGGTPAFMSPEQRASMNAVFDGRPVPHAIDRRSDIFSLGLILYVSLGGQAGDNVTQLGRLERHNANVSTGLADIVERCTREDPAKRYHEAGELAADLRRHLADRPLRGVANRSWLERWQKWRRRQPQALHLIVLALIVVIMASGAAIYITQRDAAEAHRYRLEAQKALDEGTLFFARGDYAKAVDSLERGQTLAQQCAAEDLLSSLNERLQPARAALLDARRKETVATLHALMHSIRLRSSMQTLTPAELRQLDQTCRTLWKTQGDVLERCRDRTNCDDMDRQAAMDLLELNMVWTDAHVRSAAEGGERRQALREALEMIEEAEAIFGPQHMLCRSRQAYAEALGLDQVASAAARSATDHPPRSAWDHLCVGRSLYQAQRHREAADCFRRAVDLEPQGFWPNFFEGLAAHRLGNYQEAVSAFRVCISLSPQTAEAYYNRALGHSALGATEQALQDLDHALSCNPNLAAAALNRATLRYQKKEYAQAIADLQYALDKGADPATVHYSFALVYVGKHDRSAALKSLDRALEANPEHQNVRNLRARLRKMPRD